METSIYIAYNQRKHTQQVLGGSTLHSWFPQVPLHQGTWSNSWIAAILTVSVAYCACNRENTGCILPSPETTPARNGTRRGTWCAQGCLVNVGLVTLSISVTMWFQLISIDHTHIILKFGNFRYCLKIFKNLSDHDIYSVDDIGIFLVPCWPLIRLASHTFAAAREPLIHLLVDPGPKIHVSVSPCHRVGWHFNDSTVDNCNMDRLFVHHNSYMIPQS